MGEELKPCRRCGLDVTPDGIEVTQTDTGTYTARFECPDCGEVAETCMRHSSEDFAVADVIDDWNRRWTDPALTARIEELEAERCFSKASAQEQILVRMDDKLSRIQNRQNDEDEDVFMDLAGYLILYLVARDAGEN